MWPFSKKKNEIVHQKRDIDIPDKVFIDKEKDYYEWSLEEPAYHKNRLNDLLYGSYSQDNFIELFYCLPEISSAVNEIATRVSDATWQLRKEWNDEIDYNDEDFNRLFSKPNPLVSFKDFVYQSVCYEILVGKQLWYFNKPTALEDEYKSIIAWWNLPAHKVKAELNTIDPYTSTELNDFVKYWKKLDRKFDTNKVLPICHLNLSSGTDVNDVKSMLIGAEKAIRNLIPVYEARGAIYVKRGAMGFLVSGKKDDSGIVALTKGEKKELIKDVNETYGLTGNKATVGITNQPVDFVRTQMSIAEMLPFDETLADAVAIYKVLQIPRHLVPSKDNSTFANANEDMKSFYSGIIIPWAKRYAEIWTEYMGLKEFRRYIYPDYSHIEVLQENRKEKSEVDRTYGEVWEKRWVSGICSLNEWIVANDGKKGSGSVFEKKLSEMTPDELELVKSFTNLKSNVNNNQQENIDNKGTEDKGIKKTSSSN